MPTQEYGEPLFTFGDHRAPQWAAVALGLALLLAAIIVGLLLVFAAAPPAGIADLVGAALIVGLMGFGGVVFSVIGVRDLLTDPEWHVSSTHVFRTRGTRVIKAFALRDLPPPRLEVHDAYGWTMGVWIYFGRRVIVAPTEDVAQAVAQVWQEANTR